MEKRRAAAEGEETSGKEEEVIPGLPKDQGLGCVVRIARGLHGLGSMVSRGWREALQPAKVGGLRRALGVRPAEPWALFHCFEYGTPGSVPPHYCWRFIDPLLGRFLQPIPEERLLTWLAGTPTLAHAALLDLLSARRRLQVATTVLSSFSNHLPWLLPLHSGPTFPRHGFACACLHPFVYIAGGSPRCGGPPSISPLAHRFNVTSGVLEPLAPLLVPRWGAHAFSYHNKFYVLGGVSPAPNNPYSTIECDSGEFWDPLTLSWTLVPNMFPRNLDVPFKEIDNTKNRHSIFVTVEENLYALHHSLGQLMKWEDSKKEWMPLGNLPTFPSNLGFKWTRCSSVGLDNMLFVSFANENGSIVCATCPTSQPLLQWDQVHYNSQPVGRGFDIHHVLTTSF